MWRKYYSPVYAPEGGGGSGGGGSGAGGAGAGGASGGQGGAAGGGDPWHKDVAPEIVGFWQNKQYDLADPKKVAIEASKVAFEAQKHFGVPPDRIIKLPESAADEAGWKGVWGRLGVPKEAKEYDFSAVKDAAGQPINQALADSLRSAFLARNVPKDSAPELAKAVQKHFDDARAAETADRKLKVDAGRAAIKQSWGPNEAVNREIAKQGALRLGWSLEQFDALEGAVGYETFMQTLLKIGTRTTEATFHEGGTDSNNTGVRTREGAVSRKAELMADKNWTARWLAGGAPEKREMEALDKWISGYTEERAA